MIIITITINEKLQMLRAQMKDAGVDTFLITKFDPHISEYAGEYWNCVKFISGFTGSAATVTVTMDKAILWTDGRYAIQARKELEGTEFETVVVSSKENTDYITYLLTATPANGKLAFDYKSVSLENGRQIKALLCGKNITLYDGGPIIEAIWRGRVRMSLSPVFDHLVAYCGESRKEKLARLRKEIAKTKADVYVISSLDDIAWLYNIRSRQHQALYFEGFTLVSQDKAVLYTDLENFEDVQEALEKDGVELKPYDDFYPCFKALAKGGQMTLLATPGRSSYALSDILAAAPGVYEIDIDITTTMKAVKNHVEIANTRKVNDRDCASLVKFILWIKEAVKKGAVTEYEAGCRLDALRGENENFIRPGFATICGYGENGALNHYNASPTDCLPIQPEGFLLVDSGGSYYDGTTDVTRTIVMGPITEEMKRNFTIVLKSHIALAKTIFLKGSTGHYIDAIARKPLWDNKMDFKHGTGHGVGFALSIHEGPHHIGPRPSSVVLEPGMTVSNEPGYYLEGRYGIRHENILLVQEEGSSETGDFLSFETLTYCPFDLAGIDKSLLTEEEISWLNDYHNHVYERLSPYLNGEEREWLKENTKSI